jgi:hypothetical protein
MSDDEEQIAAVLELLRRLERADEDLNAAVREHDRESAGANLDRLREVAGAYYRERVAADVATTDPEVSVEAGEAIFGLGVVLGYKIGSEG